MAQSSFDLSICRVAPQSHQQLGSDQYQYGDAHASGLASSEGPYFVSCRAGARSAYPNAALLAKRSCILVIALVWFACLLIGLPNLALAGGRAKPVQAKRATCGLVFPSADLLGGEIEEPGISVGQDLPESKVPDRVMEPGEAMNAIRGAIAQHNKERGEEDAFAWAVADSMVTLAMLTVAEGMRNVGAVLTQLNKKQVDQIIAKLGGNRPKSGPIHAPGVAKLAGILSRLEVAKETARLAEVFQILGIVEKPSSGNFTLKEWTERLDDVSEQTRSELTPVLWGKSSESLVTIETVKEVYEKDGVVEKVSYPLLRFDIAKLKAMLKDAKAPPSIASFFGGLEPRVLDQLDYFASQDMRNIASRVVERWVWEYKERVADNKSVKHLGPDPRTNPKILLQMVIGERIQEVGRRFIERGSLQAAKWAEELADAVEAGPKGGHKTPGVSLNDLGPYWAKLLRDYYEAIDNSVTVQPLTRADKHDRDVLTKIEESVLTKNPREFLPSIAKNGEGNHSLELQQNGLLISWVPELGTAVLHPKGVYPGQNSGVPMVVLLHGAGTTMSHGRSWAASMARLAKIFGIDKQVANVAAPDGLHAGAGVRTMKIPDVRVWSANARLVAEHFKFLQEQALEAREGVDKVREPLIGIGRSAGAASMDMMALAYPNATVYDVRLAFSFSNPLTIDPQIRMVLWQVEQGMLRAIDPTSLAYFRDVAEHYVLAFDKATPEQLRAFSIASLATIEAVGQSDYDGGPSVWRDHRIYRDRFGKISVAHWVHDSLAGTRIVDAEKNPDYNKLAGFFEGTHFLIGNQRNLTLEDAARYIPGVPMELLPRIESQTLEMAALPYAGMDHLIAMADVLRSGLRVEKDSLVRETLEQELAKAERLTKYLSQQRLRNDSVPRSYFEWFADKNNFELNRYSADELREHLAQKQRMLEQYKSNGETGKGVESSGLSLMEYEMRDMLARLQRIQDEFALGRQAAYEYFSEQGYIVQP